MITIVAHLKFSKFKHMHDYMLIYVKILKLSNCLNILPMGAKMPALNTLKIFFQSEEIVHFRANHKFWEKCKQWTEMSHVQQS